MVDFKCCNNCLFFSPYDDQTEDCETQGDCRRYPPMVYGDQSVCRVAFPGVMREDWCGEWKERP